jgi:23S rRNA (pseudouridine1915-N3)-methyltransferase
MKLTLVAVGSPSRLVDPAIREFETRAARYWKLETVDIAPEKASKNRPVTEVRSAEAERIRAAVPDGTELVALTRTGSTWSSRDLAQYLNRLAVGGTAGATFVVGGAYGLDRQLIREARTQLSLSPMTLPHDLARLLLAEQLYRAGTIIRGEPYHKG